MSGSFFDDRDLDILNNLISTSDVSEQQYPPTNDSCASSWNPVLVKSSYPACPDHASNHEMRHVERLPSARQQKPPQYGSQSRQGLTKTIQHKKPKRVRIAFTTDQLLALENEFSVRNYVTPAQRALIARNLKVNEKHIKTWFQNRRMRQKRMNNGSDSSSMMSDNEFGVSSTIPDLQHSNQDSVYQGNISPSYLIPDNSLYTSPQIPPESYPDSCFYQNQWSTNQNQYNPAYNGYEAYVTSDPVTSPMQVPVVTSNNSDIFSCYDSELAQYFDL